MSYPVCARCEEEMRSGGSCCDCAWQQDGHEIAAIRYGSERSPHVKYHPDHCRDCFVGVGATHHYTCTIEECPHGNQAVSCDVCEPIPNDPYYAKQTEPVQ